MIIFTILTPDALLHKLYRLQPSRRAVMMPYLRRRQAVSLFFSIFNCDEPTRDIPSVQLLSYLCTYTPRDYLITSDEFLV